MRDPHSALNQHVHRGRALESEAESLTQSAKGSAKRVHLGVDAVDYLFDLSGHKRQASAIGHLWSASTQKQRTQQVAGSFQAWCLEVEAALRLMSEGRKNITPRGNSATLVGRFARARGFKRLDTRIARSAAALDAINGLELVYNDEIPEFIRERRRDEAAAGRLRKERDVLDFAVASPGVDLVRLENRQELRQRFHQYGEVGQMIEGAVDAYLSAGADAKRQALASCRSALELTVKLKTGEADWRAGLGKLAEGSRKQLISRTYGFLSGYGSHAGGRPTQHDVAMGIRYTVGACLWLIEVP